MPFRVVLSKGAAKALAKFDRGLQTRIAQAVDTIAQDPFAPSYRQLKGSPSARRARVGNYRIVFEAIADQLIVYVIRIRHRKDVYERNR